MKSRKDKKKAIALNNISFTEYFNDLTNIALSVFKWDNLPEEIDERFLEYALLTDGQCVFFYDDIMKKYLCLQVVPSGFINVYNIPIDRQAYGLNGYTNNLNIDNSVIIYNNFTRTPNILKIEQFANRLSNIDRTIDVNINAQKTPIAVLCPESEKLALLNVYENYNGNVPVIFGEKTLDIKGITSINTQAPFISDKLIDLKNSIWNEFLTYIGVPNIQYQKKERLIQDEVIKSMGGVVASGNGRLAVRQQACEQINKMFNLNISVGYRYEESVNNE